MKDFHDLICSAGEGVASRLVCCSFSIFTLTMTAVHAAQLDDHQLQLIRDTAASICDTVKEAKGQKSDVQIRGDVKAQLGGLVRRLANGEVAGQGAIDRSEFEGLSQDATAIAMGDDRACRERLFGKMFDAVSAAVVQPARNPNALYQYDEKVADVQGAVVLPSQGTASFQMIHMIAQIDPTHELEYQDWVLVCPDLPQPKKGFVGLTSGMITGMSCRTVRRAQ